MGDGLPFIVGDPVPEILRRRAHEPAL